MTCIMQTYLTYLTLLVLCLLSLNCKFTSKFIRSHCYCCCHRDHEPIVYVDVVAAPMPVSLYR